MPIAQVLVRGRVATALFHRLSQIPGQVGGPGFHRLASQKFTGAYGDGGEFPHGKGAEEPEDLAQIIGCPGFAVAGGDAQGQSGFPVTPGTVAISQGPVQEGLHLGGDIEDIDRRGQDNRIGLQYVTDHRVVIVPDPAGAAFQAGGAAGAEADLVLTEKNLLQFQPLPGQVLSQHGQHLGGIAEAFVRGTVDGHHVVVFGHAILLFRYFSGRAGRMLTAALLTIAGQPLATQPCRPPVMARLRPRRPGELAG